MPSQCPSPETCRAHFRKFRNLTEAKRKRAEVRANHMTWLCIRPRILKEYPAACRMDSRYRDDIGHFCRGKIENLLTRHPQRYLVFHFPESSANAKKENATNEDILWREEFGPSGEGQSDHLLRQN